MVFKKIYRNILFTVVSFIHKCLALVQILNEVCNFIFQSQKDDKKEVTAEAVSTSGKLCVEEYRKLKAELNSKKKKLSVSDATIVCLFFYYKKLFFVQLIL